MADEPEDDNADETDGAAGRPKRGGRRKLVLIAVAALLLLGGGGGGAYFFLLGGGDAPAAAGATAEAIAKTVAAASDLSAERPLYLSLPNMLVNLSSDGTRQVYLRIEATLEVESTADINMIKDRSDAIVDGFQTFLREMRPRDISGSGGLVRVKEELLIRSNDAIGRNLVRNVYLTEFLIQ